jgi:hypothetical protein
VEASSEWDNRLLIELTALYSALASAIRSNQILSMSEMAWFRQSMDQKGKLVSEHIRS